MTVDEIVAAVAVEGGFDTTTEDASSAVILSWVNHARASAVADARWRKAVVSLGTTVAGTAEYDLPERVVKLEQLKVGDSFPYLRVGLSELWEAEANGSWRVTGPHDGAFAATFGEDANETSDATDAEARVRLLPVPDSSGLVIEALAAMIPPPLAAGQAAGAVGLPADLVRPICVDGAIEIGYRLVKADPNTAATFKAVWTEARDKLKARANSRIGGGPVQIRIAR